MTPKKELKVIDLYDFLVKNNRTDLADLVYQIVSLSSARELLVKALQEENERLTIEVERHQANKRNQDRLISLGLIDG